MRVITLILAAVTVVGLIGAAVMFITDIVERCIGAIRLRIRVRRCRKELDAALMDERRERGILAQEYSERRRRQALDAIARTR
jgi:hypothetical protein